MSGIVDWADACLGPAAVDVAHMRWNLAMSQGTEAADAFRHAYEQRRGMRLVDLPYWDVRTIVDTLPSDQEAAEQFDARALAGMETLLEQALTQTTTHSAYHT